MGVCRQPSGTTTKSDIRYIIARTVQQGAEPRGLLILAAHVVTRTYVVSATYQDLSVAGSRKAWR